MHVYKRMEGKVLYWKIFVLQAGIGDFLFLIRELNLDGRKYSMEKHETISGDGMTENATYWFVKFMFLLNDTGQKPSPISSLPVIQTYFT